MLSDTEIQWIRQSTDYEPMPYGEYAGIPTVSLKLSGSESNSDQVTSVQSMFDRYQWSQKLRSGQARLRIYGDRPLSEYHNDSIVYLVDQLNPLYFDIEVEAEDISSSPSEELYALADTFTLTFDFDKDEDYDEDILSELSEHIRTVGDGQFVIKSSKTSVEPEIKEFQNEYKIPDSKVWVYPKGRKMKTFADTYQKMLPFCKRNGWGLSPRLNLINKYIENQEE